MWIIDGSRKVTQKALTDNSSAKLGERYSIQEENEKKRKDAGTEQRANGENLISGIAFDFNCTPPT